MSAPALDLVQRLGTSSARVSAMAPRALLVVLAISVAGLAGAWLAESTGVVEVAGLLAGMLLAVWGAAAVVTVVLLVLVVLAKITAAALRFCAVVTTTSSKTGRGEG
jgi:hypothetical protein